MVAVFITEPLVVDPLVHAAEIERFLAKVVEGPGEYCSIWRGAIGDDGYGRYWAELHRMRQLSWPNKSW
jgi:hypothetical protein